jgi:hypothetical protein
MRELAIRFVKDRMKIVNGVYRDALLEVLDRVLMILYIAKESDILFSLATLLDEQYSNNIWTASEMELVFDKIYKMKGTK